MTPWVRAAVADDDSPLIVDTPIDAVAYLNQVDGPPERLFAELGYASYIAWAAPQVKTFVDPRFELFPPVLINDYRALSAGRFVEPLIERDGFDGFLLSRHLHAPLVTELESSDEWERVYTDDEAVIFLTAGTPAS